MSAIALLIGVAVLSVMIDTLHKIEILLSEIQDVCDDEIARRH